jgi:phage tail protein X
LLYVLVANKGYKESNATLDYKVSVELPDVP